MAEQIAVVGGTGYLGSHIVIQLLQAGYAPVVVARRPERLAKVLPGVAVETRRADVSELDSLRAALRGCAAVHAVAALLNQVYSAPTPRLEDATIRTNVEGLRNVLRAAHESGARRAVVTSTCTARYRSGGALANEDAPPTDRLLAGDAYVRSKLLADAAAAEFSRETGLEVVSILPAALIGPGDWGLTPFNRTVVDRLNGSTAPSVEGSFPLVDVRDVARGHVAAMERGRVGGAYLMVATTMPNREWASLLAASTGAPLPSRFLAPRMAMAVAGAMEVSARLAHKTPVFTRNMVRHIVQNQQYDCTRAQRELDIAFTPIEASMRDMVRWFIEHRFVSHPEHLRLP